MRKIPEPTHKDIELKHQWLAMEWLLDDFENNLVEALGERVDTKLDEFKDGMQTEDLMGLGSYFYDAVMDYAKSVTQGQLEEWINDYANDVGDMQRQYAIENRAEWLGEKV